MTSLLKVEEIQSSNGLETQTNCFVCEKCRDSNNHTIVPEPESKDGVCEWKLHA